MSMTIHSSIKAKILEAQSETSKNTSTLTEMLKGLDKQLERKEDGELYLAERIWVPGYGNLRTLIMNEAHAMSSSMAFAVICLSSGKGFSGVKTPIFEGMIVAQQVAEGVDDEVHDEGVHAAGIVAKGNVSAANDEVPTAIEEPSIPSPTPPTPPPQQSTDIPSTS
nr:putative reverse transcriptase domain-containing protein [Tanacetum cinerariifolium]